MLVFSGAGATTIVVILSLLYSWPTRFWASMHPAFCVAPQSGSPLVIRRMYLFPSLPDWAKRMEIVSSAAAVGRCTLAIEQEAGAEGCSQRCSAFSKATRLEFGWLGRLAQHCICVI